MGYLDYITAAYGVFGLAVVSILVSANYQLHKTKAQLKRRCKEQM